MPEVIAPVDLGALGPLLARDISEIADLPSFKTPPPGVYKFIIESVGQKAVGKENKPTINVVYVITDIVEQSETDIPEHEQVKPGDKFGDTFWFDDPLKLDDTLSYMKARFGGLAEAVGSTDLFTIVNGMQGMQVKAIIGNRMDKTDKTKVYPTIRDMVPSV